VERSDYGLNAIQTLACKISILKLILLAASFLQLEFKSMVFAALTAIILGNAFASNNSVLAHVDRPDVD